MKLWKWIHGRQEAEYSKLPLLLGKTFDFYLLKFPDKSSIPCHVDPVSSGLKHHRLNITVKSPCIGTGRFRCSGPYKSWLGGRIVYFRPDIYSHSLTTVDMMWSNESMYMLSFGWVTRA